MNILKKLTREKKELSEKLKQLIEKLQQTRDFSNLSTSGIEIQYKYQLINKTIAELEQDPNNLEEYCSKTYQRVTESLAIDNNNSTCHLQNYRDYCIRLAKQNLRNILEEYLRSQF